MANRQIADETIIAALLSNPTVPAAAKACKVGVSTIYKRFDDAEFCRKLDAERVKVLRQCTTRLTASINKAIDALLDVLKDPESTPQIRVNAANALLNHNAKYTDQLDILKRLEALERLNDVQQ
jgi:hypothetical protein